MGISCILALQLMVQGMFRIVRGIPKNWNRNTKASKARGSDQNQEGLGGSNPLRQILQAF